MSSGLIIFIYSIMAYGISNMFVFGSGPFKIFERIRATADNINEHVGLLFKCMMCFPANFGLILSLLNFFFLPSIPITPFNILLSETHNLWWMIALLDCGFTSGIVWLIHHIEEYFENGKTTTTETIEYIDDNVVPTEDITRKN